MNPISAAAWAELDSKLAKFTGFRRFDHGDEVRYRIRVQAGKWFDIYSEYFSFREGFPSKHQIDFPPGVKTKISVIVESDLKGQTIFATAVHIRPVIIPGRSGSKSTIDYGSLPKQHQPIALRAKHRRAKQRFLTSKVKKAKGPNKTPGRHIFRGTNPIDLFQPVISTDEGSDYGYSQSSYNLPLVYIRRTSVNTPGYWVMRNSGMHRSLPVNSFELVKSVHTYAKWQRRTIRYPGTFPQSWTVQSDKCHPNMMGVAPERPWPSHDERATNVALTRLIAECQIGLEGNVALDIVQIGQTLRSIKNTADRITGSITALRKGNFQRAVQHLVGGTSSLRLKKRLSAKKSLAENWLELQYGWKPLLQDVDASMRSLAQFMTAPQTPIIRSVRASGSVTDTLHKDWSIIDYPQPVAKESVLSSTKVTYGLRFSIESPLRTFLQQTGFTNPINLAWEILPFSFVVDWFLPVGPYLSQIDSWNGLKFVDGYVMKTTRQTVTVEYSSSQLSTNTGGSRYWMYCDGSWARERVVANRTKITNFPSPRLPSFKNPMSAMHAANALALLGAAFKK